STAAAGAQAPSPAAANAAVAQPPAAAPAADCPNPCPTDGVVVCIGSSSFWVCKHGCAVAQQPPAGMTCLNGQIVKIQQRDVGAGHKGHNGHSTLMTKTRAATT